MFAMLKLKSITSINRIEETTGVGKVETGGTFSKRRLKDATLFLLQNQSSTADLPASPRLLIAWWLWMGRNCKEAETDGASRT